MAYKFMARHGGAIVILRSDLVTATRGEGRGWEGQRIVGFRGAVRNLIEDGWEGVPELNDMVRFRAWVGV